MTSSNIGWWQQEAFYFLAEPAVQIYLSVLGVAVLSCGRIYYSRIQDGESGICWESQLDKKMKSSTLYHMPTVVSAALIGITWWYIIRFILTHQHEHTTTTEQTVDESSYFDDAYKDVLNTPNLYFTSTQLLTWAIVAVVWIAHREESALSFLVFGFFGAMSASFVVWIPSWLYQKNKQRASHEISIAYLLSSLIAFVAILQLGPCDKAMCTADTGYGSFDQSFHFWLHTLHVVLLIPVATDRLLPWIPKVRVALLYAAMSVSFAAWHLYQLLVLGLRWNMPLTDCQRSITTDLICCTLLTLWVIMASKQRQSASWFSLVASAFAFSPAAVLAAHLLQQEWPALVAELQQYAAKQRSGESSWCNLGLWGDTKTSSSYQEACERLAHALGKAARLKPNSSVLACGCGKANQELLFYKTTFQLHHITGIDPGMTDSSPQDFEEYNVRRIQAGVEELTELECLAKHSYDSLLVLDNIYHYDDKVAFFRDASQMVKKDTGVVAVTDLLWNDATPMPFWLGWILSLMGVSGAFLWNESTYRQKLSALGYRNIRITPIGTKVFRGWEFIPNFLKQRLDYAIVVADAPAADVPKKKKLRVAIIGSGMAGLSASHFLTSSANASDLEVDIYEARSVVGLAGDTICFENQMIDVPPRMASVGYYKRYLELVNRLGVPTRVVQTGCNFYGDTAKDADGNKKDVYYGVESSQLLNIWNALTIAGLRKISQVLAGCSDIAIQAAIDQSLTFGEWMEEHFEIPLSKTKDDLPTLTCSDSPFLYMLIGSLSWMLSCTYDQLISYPANIVLSYFSVTEWTGFGLFEQFRVVRINPSIKALEKAMLYGVHKLCLNTPVTKVDESKTIHGIQYDAVICATEAGAVPKVVKDCSDVFSRIRYQPSCIYMHRDDSFMPPNKRDWKCWNVQMSPGRENAELTFWLNKFYPDASFDGNVFETWAPRKKPREDLIIKKSNFQRVIHTQDTKNIVGEIEKEQGKGGIFYAGSYSVYGMGLLEEALASGDRAAAHTLKYLFPESKGVLDAKQK